MIKLAYKIHRIASYFIFLQVLFWVVGGVVFSVIPFDSIVKGGIVIKKPVQDFPHLHDQKISEHLAAALNRANNIQSLSTHPTSQGLALKLQHKNGIDWLRMSDGQALEKPSQQSIQDFAKQIYTGAGQVVSTRFLSESEYRYLGLVDELYGKTNVWQVNFDDSYGTRLYFTADSGEYLTVRNEYWVLYDALWRLHIMDYRTGNDFNNSLLRLFAISAFLFVLSGLVLTVNAMSRSLARYIRKTKAQSL